MRRPTLPILRSAATLLLASAAPLAACVEERGTVLFDVEGIDELPVDLEVVGIDWDGDTTWTREVTCVVEQDWDGNEYRVRAYDNSIGAGLRFGLTIQDYSGPGDYARDEFQPMPVLEIDYSVEETMEAWRVGTDSGGLCTISLDAEDLGKAGHFECAEVAATKEFVVLDQRATVVGDWSCNTFSDASQEGPGGGGEVEPWEGMPGAR